MRIPTGEIKPDLGNLGEFRVDEKLVIRLMFVALSLLARPGSEGKYILQCCQSCNHQIKTRYIVGTSVGPKSSLSKKFNEIESQNFIKCAGEGQGPIFNNAPPLISHVPVTRPQNSSLITIKFRFRCTQNYKINRLSA